MEVVALETEYPDGLNKVNNAFNGGTYANGYVYLAGHAQRVNIRINVLTGAMYNISFPAGYVHPTTMAFAGALYDSTYTNSVFFIPYEANMLVKVSTTTFAATGFTNFPAGHLKTSDASTRYYGGVLHSQTLFLVPSTALGIVGFNVVSNTMTAYDGCTETRSLQCTETRPPEAKQRNHEPLLGAIQKCVVDVRRWNEVSVAFALDVLLRTGLHEQIQPHACSVVHAVPATKPDRVSNSRSQQHTLGHKRFVAVTVAITISGV